MCTPALVLAVFASGSHPTASPARISGSDSGSGSPNDGWQAVAGYHCSSGFTPYGDPGVSGNSVTLAQCKSACLGMSSCDVFFYVTDYAECYTVAGACTDTIADERVTIYFHVAIAPTANPGSGSGSGSGSIPAWPPTYHHGKHYLHEHSMSARFMRSTYVEQDVAFHALGRLCSLAYTVCTCVQLCRHLCALRVSLRVTVSGWVQGRRLIGLGTTGACPCRSGFMH